MTDHVLYRFYSATGQLLYVGITWNPPTRFQSHRRTKSWWRDVAGITIEHYDSRSDLENAERRAIQVERPLHNVVRAKPTPEPPPPQREPEPESDAAALFDSTSQADAFSALFSSEPRRHTCYGYVTDAEYDRRAAVDRAKAAAIEECALCDHQGYRNMYRCNHVEQSGNAAAAQERVRRERLTLVQGGDA